MTTGIVLPSEVIYQSESSRLSDSILERIARGDTDAMRCCVDQYGNLVWTMAKRMTRNELDAEDATQEIFLELWQVASRFDSGQSSETAFIAMVARRRLIDRLRKSSGKPDVVSMHDSPHELESSLRIDAAEMKDEALKANHCLESLTPQTQRILKLSIHMAESYARIADRLGLPLGSVKSFARRGLIQLRDCMSRPMMAEAHGGNE